MEEYLTDQSKINTVIEMLFAKCEEQDFRKMCEILDRTYLDMHGELISDFRHQYSYVSGKINELKNNKKEFVDRYGLDIITNNAENLYEYAKLKGKPYLKNLFKLKDHIGLEIARIEYANEIRDKIIEYDTFAHKLENQYKESSLVLESMTIQYNEVEEKSQRAIDLVQASQNMLDEGKNTIKDVKKLAKKEKDKIESMEKEYISILGILSAILITFTSGSIFSSSVLANIHKGSIYRIVFICIILGMILINVVGLLMQFIKWIAQVEKENFMMPVVLKRINITLLILLALIVIAWFFRIDILAGNIQGVLYSKINAILNSIK